MNINDKTDARIAESIIRETERSERIDLPGVQEIVKEWKQALRKYYHRPMDKGRVIQYDDYGYMTSLFPLPEHVQDREAAEDWFDYNERRECIASPYDCTGQVFTIWHKMVYRRGQWWCYHHTGMDI